MQGNRFQSGPSSTNVILDVMKQGAPAVPVPPLTDEIESQAPTPFSVALGVSGN
jgi:hypothetical protein